MIGGPQRGWPAMTNLTAEVEVALAGTATIPRTEYEGWIRGDHRTRARVYAHALAWGLAHSEDAGGTP